MEGASEEITNDIVLRFMRLFRGSTLTHGALIPDGGIGRAQTYDRPAGEAEFASHLRGETGIGICPATPEGLVYFAAIDVDNHNGVTDHFAVCEMVAKLKLPAIVTQTRRKGAHVYFFFPEGVSGMLVVPWLQSLTKHFTKFGDPIEVFPKQRILTGKNKGNWLNLPYFNAIEGHRFAIIETQPIGLQEFVEWAEANPATVPPLKATRGDDGAETLDTMSHSEAPPCIQTILSGGCEEGARNNAIFALGTYLRIRGYEGDIASALRHWNKQCISPPLAVGQLTEISRRLAGGTYNYRCSDNPLCGACDRPSCIVREFGVRAMAEDDGKTSSVIAFHGLIKVLTNPPTYKLKVGPEDGVPMQVNVETDELFTFAIIRKKVFDTTGVLVPRMKDGAWEKILAEMNRGRHEVAAPLDAKPTAAVEAAVLEFCRAAERPGPNGKPNVGTPKDLLMGRPVAMLDSDTGLHGIYFRSQDLELHLRRKRITTHKGRELWMVLADMGCTYDEFKVDGAGILAWSKPYTAFTTTFDAPAIEERF